jgi:hypothetical protein
MSGRDTVIDLDSRRPHVAGMAACRACGHRQTSVVIAEVAEAPLQCAKCMAMACVFLQDGQDRPANMNEPLMTQQAFSAKWRERVSLPADLWLELLADVEAWLAEDLSALIDTSNALRLRAKNERDVDGNGQPMRFGSYAYEQHAQMIAKTIRAAVEEALEEAAKECESIYKAHKKANAYPIDMGGLALKCADRIRALLGDKSTQ